MTHTAVIQSQEFRWIATLPDQVHLIQGGMSDADPDAVVFLNGAPSTQVPLLLDVHYDPAALLGYAHGVLKIHIAEADPQGYLGTRALRRHRQRPAGASARKGRSGRRPVASATPATRRTGSC